jgi:hypothetical protein
VEGGKEEKKQHIQSEVKAHVITSEKWGEKGIQREVSRGTFQNLVNFCLSLTEKAAREGKTFNPLCPSS